MIVKEIGHSNVERILLFLRHSIFPVEEKMVYWKCRHLFHLNIHTNCAHEGVNSGMKHCLLPVKPQHSLAQAAKILTTNAKIKQHNTDIEVCSEMHHKKLWSGSPTAPHLTAFGESLISQEFSNAKMWQHYRISTHEWLVSSKKNQFSNVKTQVRNTVCELDFGLSLHGDANLNSQINDPASEKHWGPIPKFQRVYKVSLSSDSQQLMTCTCSHQERMGFPCCHIGCVLAEPDCDGIVMFPDMSGFPISSVRVFWWSIMYRYSTSHLGIKICQCAFHMSKKTQNLCVFL